MKDFENKNLTSKILSLIVIMLISCATSFAAKIPSEVSDYITKTIPGTDIRFDGVIILPDNTVYLPLFPSLFSDVKKVEIKESYPSAQDLKQMFLSQMEMAKDAYYINHRNTSWNQRWTAYFKSLVHIYPEQMNPDLLFLAKNQVLKGQFEQALKSVEKLPDTSRQFLNNFIKNTHRYLDGKQIIDAYLRK